MKQTKPEFISKEQLIARTKSKNLKVARAARRALAVVNVHINRGLAFQILEDRELRHFQVYSSRI